MKMKAVLFAGTGETPLYPITCTTPKLLLPIVGKPLLAHILDTLYANHVKEVCLILPYDEMRVKEAVRCCTPQGLSVYFVFEQETKTHPYLQSLASQSEPICFLYGAHFFDFDLTDAKHLHCETDADITVLGTASDYLTDGVALVTDSSERITDTMLFFERHRPLSKLADSGVYLLRPEQLFAVLQICETTESASVLPHLLPCTAYVCAQNGYCNFLDTPAAFRACSRAVLHGETRYTPLHLANGIYASRALPNGKYQIIPPVWFGENVTVSDGAQIGPNTVLCDNSFIGTGACVAQSVVCSGVAVYQNAKLHGAVVCENAVIKRGRRWRSAVWSARILRSANTPRSGRGCVFGNNRRWKTVCACWAMFAFLCRGKRCLRKTDNCIPKKALTRFCLPPSACHLAVAISGKKSGFCRTAVP